MTARATVRKTSIVEDRIGVLVTQPSIRFGSVEAVSQLRGKAAPEFRGGPADFESCQEECAREVAELTAALTELAANAEGAVDT